MYYPQKHDQINQIVAAAFPMIQFMVGAQDNPEFGNCPEKLRLYRSWRDL